VDQEWLVACIDPTLVLAWTKCFHEADIAEFTRYMRAITRKGKKMTGTTRSSADLDQRRRRNLIRSWRRGIREMDLVLGGFADAHIASLTEAELDTYEELLTVNDITLMNWITGAEPIPAEYDTELFARIRDSNTVFAS